MAYRLKDARETQRWLKACKQCGSEHVEVQPIRKRPRADQVVGDKTGWHSVYCATCGADSEDHDYSPLVRWTC